MTIAWGTLRALAARQCDLLTRRQCLRAGMTARAVQWRVRSGRWARLHPGVFLTRPGRTDWLMTATAALLRVDSGDAAADAALCGDSAAYAWGLTRHPPRAVEVVVPYAKTVAAPTGATLRRSLRWDDLVHELAYPWRTTVPVTVLAVATGGSEADALSLVARAVQKRLTTAGELRQEMVARGGHRYSKLLRQALAEVDDGAESGAEVLYVRHVERAHGLPRSTAQSPSSVGRQRRHDFEYGAFGVLVEVDGRLGHEQWVDRVRDGQRDRQLLTIERATTRVFWPDCAITPCSTAQEIGAILRARGWTGTLRRCRRPHCSVAPSGV